MQNNIEQLKYYIYLRVANAMEYENKQSLRTEVTWVKPNVWFNRKSNAYF